jgi:tRNA threonylcarbamoyladenosine biosynthesis protein TsaE
MKKQLTTTNPEETEAIAQKLGTRLKGGEVIELVSDLGGGKTTFTRGLVKGVDSQDRVASPTFTISKVYKGKAFEVHHFDFYRLADAGLMAHEIHDVIGEPDIVVVVEWGDVVSHVLPQDRLTIRLKRTGDESRALEFEYPQSRAYLTEGL